jgi:hypothetical protein
VLSLRDPLIVALRAGERVRIGLRCTRALRLRVNGEDFDVTPAMKELVVPGAAMLRIEWRPADADAIAFSNFEVLAA